MVTRSLLHLARTAGSPHTSQVLPALQEQWGGGSLSPCPDKRDKQQQKYARHNQILTIIVHAIDQVLDRGRETLAQTYISVQEIFGCRIPRQRTRRRPLGRLQPETERQYVQYWKQFLCFLIRAISLPEPDRISLLGVYLDKEQSYTLQIL
ncbi:hypothetical protein N7509_012767 [Penicillium cosmopolitanum]|uniref:Uncharacterized protein n=1 Tax=Penicillium cosmopolitanum TaxID=1131564 RepID=A0A9W9VDY8_9EURO|nr:uncharacterized protein N7509_012767 [Penicillium cosmopolitanum]KAJ5375881.1 hypothetical protein N7509_012767 [Penicillium cosmopolitanum]